MCWITMSINYDIVKQYLDKQRIKAVEIYDFSKKKVKYSDKITGWKINTFKGDEEVTRAYLLAKLTNELGYKLENIEIEREYDIGRPKVNKPRNDVLVKYDNSEDIFLYIEVKSPDQYNPDDDTIEKQLFNLASQEIGKGRKVKYLVLYTIDTKTTNIEDKCIVIDYENYKTYEQWNKERISTNQIPALYGKSLKKPYVKGSDNDLKKDFTHEQLNSLRKRLHDILWGGGSIDDNEIFSFLVNIILAKIQDESEKADGETYEFQIFTTKDGEDLEPDHEIFNRLNNLYRRALEKRLNILDKNRLQKSFIVDENKFPLSKLKYVVSELEGLSFVDGKNSLDGKDILGDFFEGIIREGFKQTKGQFFTPINIVRFILWGLKLDELVINKINNDCDLPYMIDPSAGSGTFLIEYMKFVTEVVKRRFTNQIRITRDIEDKLQKWFYPDHRENRWAETYIYGIEHNFNLGTATKVNMILHGDGSSNIFVKDGLLPFEQYNKETEPNVLNKFEKCDLYENKNVNEKFDVIITNPPFSVDFDNDTKRFMRQTFIFADKKNSENLFIERYYQLLKPNGRLCAVLPESVFDTGENKYIRLFIYKYFKVKAIISLPQLTFEPFTTTKTSLLFAQKKTKEEIKLWNDLWDKYSKEWANLKTRCENLLSVYLEGKDRSKLKSIKDLSNEQEIKVIKRLLKDYIEEDDNLLSSEELIRKYQDEIKELCTYDKETKEVFGYVNTWWVFGEVAKELNYPIFMAEVENVGYKRTKRGENPMPNELFREGEIIYPDGTKKWGILVDDGVKETALDFVRDIKWD